MAEGILIDNDGPYSPNNCRWTTAEVSANNCRSNVRLEAFGETKTIAEWSRDQRCVVKEPTLWARLRVYGWNLQDALTEPSRHRKV